MTLINCSECGKEIAENVLSCPNCGFPITNKETIEQPIYKNKKYVGIAMCIIGCILFIVAFSRINNNSYEFYLGYYETCMQGYNENTTTANSYSSGFLKSSYENIASKYKDLAEDAYMEICKFRTEAVVSCGAGIILLVIGYRNIKNKENRDGTH